MRGIIRRVFTNRRSDLGDNKPSNDLNISPPEKAKEVRERARNVLATIESSAEFQSKAGKSNDAQKEEK